MNIDRYYTPVELAENMVQASNLVNPMSVADFAVGDGSLLSAARKRWPNSLYIATDISDIEIASLHKIEPYWHIGKCDFLNPKSRACCKVLRRLKGTVSLIILNPPFSCRGGTRWRVKFMNELLSCSLAMAFIINSIEYLGVAGELIAVLPAGCLHSEKDKRAWQALNQSFGAEVISRNKSNAFTGCSPSTVVVRLTRLSATQCLRIAPEAADDRVTINSALIGGTKLIITRGRLQMNFADRADAKKPLPLIHSTELYGTHVDLARRVTTYYNRTLCGPAVLLPRVGNPAKPKVTVYHNQQPIVLSDCVIALLCETVQEANNLQLAMTQYWHIIQNSYGGTGARYVTMDTLSKVLISFGADVEVCGT